MLESYGVVDLKLGIFHVLRHVLLEQRILVDVCVPVARVDSSELRLKFVDFRVLAIVFCLLVVDLKAIRLLILILPLFLQFLRILHRDGAFAHFLLVTPEDGTLKKVRILPLVFRVLLALRFNLAASFFVLGKHWCESVNFAHTLYIVK